MKWVPVGKLTRTHGLKGEFKFRPLSAEQDALLGLKHLKVQGSQEKETELKLESLRGHPSNFIIKFRGIDSIEDAKALAGQSVFALESEFPELPAGDYYRFQIEGLAVYDLDGRYYGRVEDIIETGSNDVYVVRDGDREILIPMIDWVVKSIDINEKKLIFENVEGLIEDSPV